MSDPYSRLIDALAGELVREYLAEEAAPDGGPESGRTHPVPLPDMDQAA